MHQDDSFNSVNNQIIEEVQSYEIDQLKTDNTENKNNNETNINNMDVITIDDDLNFNIKDLNDDLEINKQDVLQLENITTPDQQQYEPVEEKKENISDLLYGNNNIMFIEDIDDKSDLLEVKDINNLNKTENIQKEVLNELDNIKTIHIDDKSESKKKKFSLFEDANWMMK